MLPSRTKKLKVEKTDSPAHSPDWEPAVKTALLKFKVASESEIRKLTHVEKVDRQAAIHCIVQKMK
jgi:hypothetical protein